MGEGAFGVVLKAHVKTQQEAHTGPFGATATNTHNTPKKYVAIKQMMNKREGQGIPIDAIREIKVLKELRHENIVSLDRIFTRPDKQEIDLVYEYAEHDLAEIIKVNRAKAMNNVQPDPRFVKSVLQQVLTGLAFLHQSWIVHRDMKPANILLTDVSHAPDGTEEGGKVKIGEDAQTETQTHSKVTTRVRNRVCVLIYLILASFPLCLQLILVSLVSFSLLFVV